MVARGALAPGRFYLAVPVFPLGTLRQFHIAAVAKLPLARIPSHRHNLRPPPASATALVALASPDHDIYFNNNHDGLLPLRFAIAGELRLAEVLFYRVTSARRSSPAIGIAR